MESVDWLQVAIGAAFLAGGWILYWFSLRFAGAVMLGTAVTALGLLLFGNRLEPGLPQVLLAAGLLAVGAALGIALAKLMHNLVFFLAGAALGAGGYLAGLAAVLGQPDAPFGNQDAMVAFGAPVAAIVGGVLAVWLARWVVMLGTSLAGAIIVGRAIEFPLRGVEVVALTLIGFSIQMVLTSGGCRRGMEDSEED